MMAYLQCNDLYVQDCYAGNHPEYRMKVRVINETAWHNLFVRTMFVRAGLEELKDFEPELTIIHAPSFLALPEVGGVERETFVALNLEEMEVLIGGTAYAGEQKKSAFSVLNYLLPQQRVLPMHSSANIGKADKDVCVFFGLSGTGKTTLSTDPEQAMYHFMSGYTAKVAGTEKGVKEPQATFSACFGQPFMMLHPYEYAKLLAERMKKHDVSCWLINTGWSGGPYGVGERMPIKYSRAVVTGALSGKLRDAQTREDPNFGFAVPLECEGVPADVLDARKTWQDGVEFDAKAKELAARFRDNFKAYADVAPKEVIEAGPK